jgi:hypothetical protein
MGRKENVQREHEGTRGWRKLNNEEILNLPFSPNYIMMIKSRKARNVGRKGERRKTFRILVGKTKRKRPTWETQTQTQTGGYIKIDLKETVFECVGWICVAQDRDQWRALVNTVMNLRVP